MPQPKFLVIGASGLLGQRFLRMMGENAVGTFYEHPFVDGIRFDVTRPDFTCLDRAKATHMLILAAKTGMDFCAKYPCVTSSVNVNGVMGLLEYALSRGMFPIFASSDAVYPDHGRGFAATEDIVPAPATTYGKQKLEAERLIRDQFKESLILRLSKLIDADLDPRGLLGPWLTNFMRGVACDVFIDRFFNPVDVRDVCAFIADLAQIGMTGVLNIGGIESLSYCDLALFLAKRCHKLGGAPFRPTIQSLSVNLVDFLEPRSQDSTISTRRLRALGMFPRPLESTCDDAVRNFVKANLPGVEVRV